MNRLPGCAPDEITAPGGPATNKTKLFTEQISIRSETLFPKTGTPGKKVLAKLEEQPKNKC